MAYISDALDIYHSVKLNMLCFHPEQLRNNAHSPTEQARLGPGERH
jgi:hypothetical protein